MSAQPNSLEFLQAVFLNEQLPLTVRMRAAIESLPYEQPKLMAVAHGHFQEGTFAELLDRAIERSQKQMKLIEHTPASKAAPVANEQLPPEVLKKPMSKLRRF